MAISTRVVSGASERPEATIDAGMSGTSGSLVGSLWAMMPPVIGALRGDFVADNERLMLRSAAQAARLEAWATLRDGRWRPPQGEGY